jgi:hypothetical protein
MMSDGLFNKIINELKELHFKGDVSLSSLMIAREGLNATIML